MPTWHLENAEANASKNKYTFYKPGASEIARIRCGENVKLIFFFDSDLPGAPEAERMWVIVDSVDGTGGFTGRLDNDPKWIKDIKAGDHLEFRDIHIINTEHDDHNNIVNKYLPRCFVTQRILKDGQKIGYLYREEPDSEKDSGWRILAGDESDAYMNASDNTAFVSLGRVLNCDDSILDLLDAPAGSAFQRDGGTNEFVRIENP